MYFNQYYNTSRKLKLILKINVNVDQGSAIGMATRYGLDGLGIEFRCWGRFSAPVQTDPGAHPASYIMGTESFPGVKRPGRGGDHSPPSSADVKGRVELYFNPSFDFRGLGQTLPYFYLYLYFNTKT